MATSANRTLPCVGDKIWVIWKDGNKVKANVTFIHKTSTIKRGSEHVYTLVDIKTREEIKTRLLHLEWSFVKNKTSTQASNEKSKADNDEDVRKTKKSKLSQKVHQLRAIPLPLPSHRLILGIYCTTPTLSMV